MSIATTADVWRCGLACVKGDQALRERHTAKQTELWRMRKGDREVRCVAVYISVGVDLRLLEGGDMLRTELLRDAYALPMRAREWQRALAKSGWQEPGATASQSPIPRNNTRWRVATSSGRFTLHLSMAQARSGTSVARRCVGALMAKKTSSRRELNAGCGRTAYNRLVPDVLRVPPAADAALSSSIACRVTSLVRRTPMHIYESCDGIGTFSLVMKRPSQFGFLGASRLSMS